MNIEWTPPEYQGQYDPNHDRIWYRSIGHSDGRIYCRSGQWPKMLWREDTSFSTIQSAPQATMDMASGPHHAYHGG